MKALDKIFTAVALLGLGITAETQYQKQYLKQCPKNYHLIVKDRNNNTYASTEEAVRIIPWWQKAQLLRTHQKYEITSRAASKDKQVVNVHLLVQSEVTDVIKAFNKYGKDVENTIRERLAIQLKLACQAIHSKTDRNADLKKAILKQLEKKIVKPFEKAGMNIKIQVVDVVMNEPLKLRYLPELLI